MEGSTTPLPGTKENEKFKLLRTNSAAGWANGIWDSSARHAARVPKMTLVHTDTCNSYEKGLAFAAWTPRPGATVRATKLLKLANWNRKAQQAQLGATLQIVSYLVLS